MACVEPISPTTRNADSSVFTWSSARSSASREPEPGSRTMRGSRWTSASVTVLRFAHACPAGTTTTSSSAISSRARRVFGPGGAPTTPTSASPSSTHAVTWRLEPLRRQIERSGYLPLNRPIRAAGTAATAGRHRRRRCEAAGGPQTEHRQLAHHVRARAPRARDGGRGAGDVLLELLLAMRAAVFVDRHPLLTTTLDVALDELFGILLEDVVDLVEELVDVFLDLFALLGELRAAGSAVAALGGLGGLGLLLLLLLSHRALP